MKLTRSQTLKRSFEFAAVREHGVAFATKSFVVSILKKKIEAGERSDADKEPPSSRMEASSHFGIICTRKLGKAHVRNALRRRMREILRQQGELLTLSGTYDVVVIMRRRATEVSYAELIEDWARAIRGLKSGRGKPASERPVRTPRTHSQPASSPKKK